MSDKSNHLYKSVANSFAATSLLQVIAICSDILFIAILARLLSPADYGTVAAAGLFIAFCEMLREVGIGATIIQMSKLSIEDQRTGLTIVLISASLIFAIIQLVAPLFSEFMRMPEVEQVLRVLAFLVLIQAIATISQGMLLRNLRSSKVMIIEIVSKILAYATLGVGMAYLGYGYWALVGATLLEALLRSVGFTLVARPSLRPAFHRDSFRRLMTTGSGFAVSRIINFIALRADAVIVGRYLDAASLGLYSRAYRLMSMPADLYSKTADRVVFPAMARVQHEPVRLRSAFARGIRLTALLGLPLSVGLFLLAPEIIAFLLGPKWAAVVPIFSVLVAATYFRLSARVSGSLLRATGALRALIVSQIFYAGLTITGSLVAVSHGVVAVGAAIGAAVIAWYILITWYACRAVGFSFFDFLRAHWHGLVLSAVVGTLTFLLLICGRALHLPSFAILAGIFCLMTALGLALVVTKPRALIGDEGVGLAAHLQAVLTTLVRRMRGMK